jgi:hypothetical protein
MVSKADRRLHSDKIGSDNLLSLMSNSPILWLTSGRIAWAKALPKKKFGVLYVIVKVKLHARS